MNFPEFSFMDSRLAKVKNGFHHLGASRGQFAHPEAKSVYVEIQAMAQEAGAKSQHVGALLTQLAQHELIRDQWSDHPSFTIDHRVHDGFLNTSARIGAEALFDALTTRAAEMVGKTVVINQVTAPAIVD